jgi:hypothetical protein
MPPMTMKDICQFIIGSNHCRFGYREPQRVCDRCYEVLRPADLQNALAGHFSKAAQSPVHDVTDWTSMRAWLNNPLTSSLEQDIYKCTNIFGCSSFCFWQLHASFLGTCAGLCHSPQPCMRATVSLLHVMLRLPKKGHARIGFQATPLKQWQIGPKRALFIKER